MTRAVGQHDYYTPCEFLSQVKKSYHIGLLYVYVFLQLTSGCDKPKPSKRLVAWHEQEWSVTSVTVISCHYAHKLQHSI